MQLDDRAAAVAPEQADVVLAGERGTPAVGDRDVGDEALRLEDCRGPPDVALADEDVEVAELAQREMAVEGLGQRRSLERHGLDAVGV